jgi:CDP-glucose 4,6-dehydratase
MTTGSGYESKCVLVTGGQGFMGSWLVERLLAERARVLVPRRPASEGSRFERNALGQRCEQIDLDLLDLPSLVRALNENDVEVVFHLAAQTIVATANASPMATFDVNVRGTYNLLEAARILRSTGAGPGLVVASSYHAYGKHETGGYSDDTPLRPSYPYDVSKACADMLAR